MTAEQLFFEAGKKINQELFPEAKTLLLQAIELDPNYGRAYNHLGWLYDLKFRDYAKSEEYYKKALETSPEYVPIYVNYAVVLNNVGKEKELEELLKKGFEVPGTDHVALNREFGFLREKQGKFEEAIQYYTAALKSSWVNQDVETFKNAIERCKSKMQTLKDLA